MKRASASHILLKTEKECMELKKEIENGKDFSEAAREKSLCPSGKSGGDLGTFSPGQMVAEFDKVVFNEEMGKVHGAVKTQFGYHLVKINSRS